MEESVRISHFQTYVAESRCTDLEGIVLRSRLCKSDLIVQHHAKQFCTYSNLDLISAPAIYKTISENQEVVKELEKTRTPEEQELHEKLQELSALESELTQKELDLATLTAELLALESRYIRVVGGKYAELDRINAEIAEFLASQEPEDLHAQSEAQAARQKAEDSAREAGEMIEPSKVETFKPTKELKELYRKIAKMIHPDLAVDEEEYERRTKIMAEVNKAYEEGDVERLEAILSEWETSPEFIEGEDVGSRLVRAIRMIARVKRRIKQIEKDIKQLMQSDLYELKLKVDAAENEGKDLIEEIVEKIDNEILKTREYLKTLKA